MSASFNLRGQTCRRGIAAYLEKPLTGTRLPDAIAHALGDAADPRS